MKDEFIGKRFSPHSEFRKGVRHRHRGHITYALARETGKQYRLIYKPEHPYCTSRGYVREHRLVMEGQLGRLLKSSEIVHHIDSNTLNNSPDNLQVLDKKAHDRMNVNLNIHRRWTDKGVDAQ